MRKMQFKKLLTQKSHFKKIFLKLLSQLKKHFIFQEGTCKT